MRKGLLLLAASFLLLTCSVFTVTHVTAGLSSFEITKIDTDGPFYATFQSYNQKVVQNDKGIFLTYLLDWNANTWSTHWRLMRSTDGGRTFQLLYGSPETGSNTPALATDENNNLFLACTDVRENIVPMFFYRFDASSDYVNYTKYRYEYSGAFCWSMVYDQPRNRIFIFNTVGKLLTIKPDTGQLIATKQVVNHISKNNKEYVYTLMDLGEDEILHHGWTTQWAQHMYYDIHYAQSHDGGVTWQKADGTNLITPFDPDDGGPADQISLPDEYYYQTWLSNMIVKNGKVHFAYFVHDIDPQRQHYVRLDLTTGQIDKNVYPIWSGNTLSITSSDGFFATRSDDPNSPLVFVGGKYTKLVALISWDNGDTWSDLAMSDWTSTGYVYSVGGSAEITDDGYVIGSFTDQHGGVSGDPYFFKICLPSPIVCPDCLGDAVVLENVTFPAGKECECNAATSISIRPEVKIENGAIVRFKTPTIRIKSGFYITEGAKVYIEER